METKILKVNGMNCEHCVKAVRAALDGLSGLSGIVITLEDKTVSFSYNPSVISLSAITAAIAGEGFDVTG